LQTILNYFHGASSKALTKGLSRAIARDKWIQIGCHWEKGANADARSDAYLRALVPRSMVQAKYTTHIHIRVIGEALTVMKCWCSCPANALDKCTHVSTMLYTINDMVKASGRLGASCTSKLRAWGVPTGKMAEDVRLPICDYIFDKHAAASSGNGTRRRESGARMSKVYQNEVKPNLEWVDYQYADEELKRIDGLP